jgi:hypothetical protein
MNMESKGFDISIEITSHNQEDWSAALHAPVADVPVLSEHDKELYRKLFPGEDINFEKLARVRLASEEGRKRLERTAESLGRIVVDLLAEIQPDCQLDEVILKQADKWLLLLSGPQTGQTWVEVPRSLGQDLADAPRPGDRQALKKTLEQKLLVSVRA